MPQIPEGNRDIQVNPAHKLSNAQLYRVEEVQALYKRLGMTVRTREASDNMLDAWWGGEFTLAHYHKRLKVAPNEEIALIDDAGHMMHHDQPGVLTALIERFIA